MTLIETLLAYSKKEATKDHVLRALCEHDGWVAPAGFAYVATKSELYDRVSIWGAESRVPAHKLYLFTDRAAAEAAAAKVQLGPYVSPVMGARLLAGLPAGFTELHVNPSSPQEQCWFMGGDALGLAALWGQAIDIEQVLTDKAKGNLIDMLIAFPGYTSFAVPSGVIATAVGAAGMKNPAMIFTAPDCADLALQKLGAQAASLKRVVTGGEQLFSAYPKLGIDGFLVNPFGPGPMRVFNDEVCRGVIESIAAKAEIRRLEALAAQES